MNDQVAALKQEEQRLKEKITQLEQQLSTHQGTGTQRGPGAFEAVLKQREAELQQVSSLGHGNNAGYLTVM